MKAYNEVARKIVYRSRWPVLYTQRPLYPVTESTSARSEVLELSRHSGSTDLSNDTTEAARTPSFSLFLSFSDSQSPMSFIEWTFLTFQARADFRSNAPKKRRFTEAIRNRLGGGNDNGGAAAFFFQGLPS